MSKWMKEVGTRAVFLLFVFFIAACSASEPSVSQFNPSSAELEKCGPASVGGGHDALITLDEYFYSVFLKDRPNVSLIESKCVNDICYELYFEAVGSTGWRRIATKNENDEVVALARCYRDVLQNATCSIRVQIADSRISSGRISTADTEQVAKTLHCIWQSKKVG